MERRQEEQLAGYGAASFRVLSSNNTASQAVQMINKLATRRNALLPRQVGLISGDLTVGELSGVQHAGGRG